MGLKDLISQDKLTMIVVMGEESSICGKNFNWSDMESTARENGIDWEAEN